MRREATVAITPAHSNSVHWQSEDDAKVLGERTAAAIAAGEAMLVEIRAQEAAGNPFLNDDTPLGDALARLVEADNKGQKK